MSIFHARMGWLAWQKLVRLGQGRFHSMFWLGCCGWMPFLMPTTPLLGAFCVAAVPVPFKWYWNIFPCHQHPDQRFSYGIMVLRFQLCCGGRVFPVRQYASYFGPLSSLLQCSVLRSLEIGLQNFIPCLSRFPPSTIYLYFKWSVIFVQLSWSIQKSCQSRH